MKTVKKLSIIIPVYNEGKTIEKIVARVVRADLGNIKKEIIIVDDGSTDGTSEVLESMKQKKLTANLIYLRHVNNRGKSRALRTGFEKATGEVVVVQDGDMEYDPNDFKKMLDKMAEPKVQVVYGSRRIEPTNKQYSGLDFYLGGLMLTYMANILYGCRITDEPTCYKMVERKLLDSLKLKSVRFEFCPEVTAKIARKGIEICEVPISYKPRHVDQGKKIKLRDFFEAVWTLISLRFKGNI